MSFQVNKNEIFSYFVYENGKKYYLMQKWFETNQNDNYLKLSLTDCTNYWTKTFSKREIEKSSNLSNFDLNGIKLQFSHAFKNESRDDFLIKVAHSEDFTKTTLTLKKVLESEIKVEVTNLTLDLVDDPTPKIQETFNYCIDSIDGLESHISSLENEIKRLSDERRKAMEDLDKCIKEKDEIEEDLYSKFVMVLNQKKEKIKELISQKDE